MWLESIAKRYGDQLALACDKDTLTYSQLLNASWCCAIDLVRRGMKKGDRVILMGINGLDWIISFFGIVLAGGVAALANYSLSSKDTTTLTQLVDAKWAVLVVDDIFGLRPEAVAQAIEMGGVSFNHILNGRKLYETASDPASILDPATVQALSTLTKAQDTQKNIFTTGTTSKPKAVQLSSCGMLTNAFGSLKINGKDIGKAVCQALSMFHIFGLVNTLRMLENGCFICLPREISSESVLELLERYKVDTLVSVGTVFRMLVELPEFKEKGEGKIKTCIWGASGITPTDVERMQMCLGAVQILPGYGLSECSCVVSTSSSDIPLERRMTTVGRLNPNQDVRIWMEDRGFLPQGEIGEIVVKGPCVMNGYLGIPREDQPIDGDGWLHTGDLGVITEDGLLQLKGRIKDLIKRAGENISPAEIEKALLEEPSISDAKVMGIPHPVLGESVEACVVLRDGELDERKLRAALRKKLSPYKIPSHIFAFSALPQNANGKLNQRLLKEMVLERLREEYK